MLARATRLACDLKAQCFERGEYRHALAAGVIDRARRRHRTRRADVRAPPGARARRRDHRLRADRASACRTRRSRCSPTAARWPRSSARRSRARAAACRDGPRDRPDRARLPSCVADVSRPSRSACASSAASPRLPMCRPATSPRSRPGARARCRSTPASSRTCARCSRNSSSSATRWPGRAWTPTHLAVLLGYRDVAPIYYAATGSAFWYLALKNWVVASQVRPKLVIFFFRDENLTDADVQGDRRVPREPRPRGARSRTGPQRHPRDAHRRAAGTRPTRRSRRSTGTRRCAPGWSPACRAARSRSSSGRSRGLACSRG